VQAPPPRPRQSRCRPDPVGHADTGDPPSGCRAAGWAQGWADARARARGREHVRLFKGGGPGGRSPTWGREFRWDGGALLGRAGRASNRAPVHVHRVPPRATAISRPGRCRVIVSYGGKSGSRNAACGRYDGAEGAWRSIQRPGRSPRRPRRRRKAVLELADRTGPFQLGRRRVRAPVLVGPPKRWGRRSLGSPACARFGAPTGVGPRLRRPGVAGRG